MNWKHVLLTAVIALLVVVLALVVFKIIEPQTQRDIRTRIKQYEIVAKEQRLITEILTLRYEAALIQAKFKPQQRPAQPPVPQPGVNVPPPPIKE